MRIRRKKHLLERKENVKDILFVADFDIPNSNLAILDKKYIDFENHFGNDNPLCLEIGCGKGLFVCESAKQNPQNNYIAVELLDNISPKISSCIRLLTEEAYSMFDFKKSIKSCFPPMKLRGEEKLTSSFFST